MKNKFVLLCLITFLLCTFSTAGAESLGLNSGWQTFTWTHPDNYRNKIYWDQTFEFTLSNPAVLTVTDAYEKGDRWTIFNYGASLGETPWVPKSTVSTADYDVAASDPTWSTDTFELTPGTYQITGKHRTNAYGNSSGGIRLDGVAHTPIPGTLWLFGPGVVGLAALRKRLFK
mgnify:FL=1